MACSSLSMASGSVVMTVSLRLALETALTFVPLDFATTFASLNEDTLFSCRFLHLRRVMGAELGPLRTLHMVPLLCCILVIWRPAARSCCLLKCVCHVPM